MYKFNLNKETAPAMYRFNVNNETAMASTSIRVNRSFSQFLIYKEPRNVVIKNVTWAG